MSDRNGQQTKTSSRHSQSRYAKTLRARIIEYREQQNRINDLKLKIMLVNEPEVEVRKSLETIHNALNGRFNGNRALYSNTEIERSERLQQ